MYKYPLSYIHGVRLRRIIEALCRILFGTDWGGFVFLLVMFIVRWLFYFLVVCAVVILSFSIAKAIGRITLWWQYVSGS
jgi:hypothetical protein